MSFCQKPVIAILIVFAVLLFPTIALGDGTYVYVTDASQIHYQITQDNRVYFRNLNSFNPSVTGCCYAFYLDLDAVYGRIVWSTILFKMAVKKNIYLYVSETNPPTSGSPAEVTNAGNW